jgi:hypothetical protein
MRPSRETTTVRVAEPRVRVKVALLSPVVIPRGENVRSRGVPVMDTPCSTGPGARPTQGDAEAPFRHGKNCRVSPGHGKGSGAAMGGDERLGRVLDRNLLFQGGESWQCNSQQQPCYDQCERDLWQREAGFHGPTLAVEPSRPEPVCCKPAHKIARPCPPGFRKTY